MIRGAALALAVAMCACGGSQGNRSSANNGVVLVTTSEPEASIWVDGKFVAVVGRARGGVSVTPGKHRIEIRHDRFHTHYQIVDVGPKQRLVLDVELAEDLP